MCPATCAAATMTAPRSRPPLFPAVYVPSVFLARCNPELGQYEHPGSAKECNILLTDLNDFLQDS
jgi:hypothetical protein